LAKTEPYVLWLYCFPGCFSMFRLIYSVLVLSIGRRMVRVTCLSQQKVTLALLLLLFETLDLQDFRSAARSSTRSKHRAQTCRADKQEKLRTIHQAWKDFKRGQGLVLGPWMQKNRNYRKIWIISHKVMCLVNFNSKLCA
jgi:hypothetical protein